VGRYEGGMTAPASVDNILVEHNRLCGLAVA
jgi:hypothetical protein